MQVKRMLACIILFWVFYQALQDLYVYLNMIKNTILFAFVSWIFAQYLLGKITLFFSAGYYLK